ncbi:MULTISPECIES: HAD family hydrolase [Sphingobacterium]|jgi:putative hydrolase of the HAD superfamily|uniref:HAD family hydrolase n=2 Tax=Sphingobacterium TaxID=28453 RepID=A0ACD5C5Y7_9SPHI|nr:MULTISPECIES: HAD family hydrolase [Sphingobacterium]HAE69890.1 HAD family hydrolase [Sphingobacterium sp.]OFV10173.1 haloacid dehalogenase [Sphingobacterium sp. HMSC13C05]OJZ07578.1 MAG: haloacid dehalogenase [Sphingobacterium sp. 40-24]QQT45155.1 HAD family hydrolase [Sphingobacterium multivorum]SUJ21393.1 dUMP phosphatase [Sphingobacterium multivorum]
MDKFNIKGIIFDYGGTLDTNGGHWGAVIWSGYEKYQVPVNLNAFQEAYTYAERQMALQPIIKPQFNFLEVLEAKLNVQFDYLIAAGYDLDRSLAHRIAFDGYSLAKNTVEEVKPLLNSLHEKYPIVMVSNFYGNLKSVLDDFGILSYFQEVVESAVVGVRKPDPAIYALGVTKIGLPAQEVLVVGDSYSKDMVPAKAVGCQTLWLKGQTWGEDKLQDTGAADQQFTSIFDLIDFV